MLKIYPSPFNKLVFFILYGLLSVAAITLAQTPTPTPQGGAAQVTSGGGGGSLSASAAATNTPSSPSSNECPLAPSPSDQKIIGYFNLDSPGASASIKWDYYDFINVIAYQKVNQGPWNDIRPPSPSNIKQITNPLNDLISNKKQAKVLLSIRNFDLGNWPSNEDEYNSVVVGIGKMFNSSKLDGVDIEYPGMRGSICDLWDQSRDSSFINFIKNVSDLIGDKTLMLTVGNNVINGLDNNLIDYFNIETYHYSFYENLGGSLPDSRVKSNPNAPLGEFGKAYSTWKDAGIDDKKIIMGIDLGNTFQIVDNQAILSSQTVETGIHDSSEVLNEVNTIPQINFCTGGGDKLKLYSYPWKRLVESQFITLSGNCNNVTGALEWVYHFDEGTSTSWLIKDPNIAFPNQPPNQNPKYYYLSFEDPISLNRKLKFSTAKSIGGISISDILYDDDNVASSLVNFIQTIRSPNPNPPTDGPSPSGNTANPSGTDASTNPTQNEGNRETGKTGKIIGGVLGSVFGLVILGGILFVGYKHKDKIPFIQNKFGNEKMYHGTSYTNQPGMIPEGSPRMIIPETTAVPVAPSFVTAMFDFAGKEENDLSFKKGDKIEVLERGDGPNDWWVGRVNGAVGEFPGNYVKE